MEARTGILFRLNMTTQDDRSCVRHESDLVAEATPHRSDSSAACQHASATPRLSLSLYNIEHIHALSETRHGFFRPSFALIFWTLSGIYYLQRRIQHFRTKSQQHSRSFSVCVESRRHRRLRRRGLNSVKWGLNASSGVTCRGRESRRDENVWITVWWS